MAASVCTIPVVLFVLSQFGKKPNCFVQDTQNTLRKKSRTTQHITTQHKLNKEENLSVLRLEPFVCTTKAVVVFVSMGCIRLDRKFRVEQAPDHSFWKVK